MAAPEPERWTSLTIPSCYTKLDVEDFLSTHNVLSMKTFTALRELRIDGIDTYYDTVWDFDSSCGGWNMPSLRIIKSRNTLPSMQLTSLTGLHLHVGDSDISYFSGIDLEEITTFLQSVPSLTELSLVIGWFKGFSFDAGPEVTLPNVKKLRLEVKVESDADSSLTDFLASLHTPKLSDLSVDVATYYAYQLTDWVGGIFREGNGFWPSLESLDLSMSYRIGNGYLDDPEDEPMYAPDDLFERIPAVRHLSIYFVDVFPPGPTCRNIQLPHLRTLYFRDCNKFDTDSILGICDIFEAAEFETLKIHNCEKIDTEVVRERMPDGKACISIIDWNIDISVL